MKNPMFLIYANNKGADQPAHPHSLICNFDVRCLDCKTLAGVFDLDGRFVSFFVEIPEDRISRISPDGAHSKCCLE